MLSGIFVDGIPVFLNLHGTTIAIVLSHYGSWG